MIKGAISWKSIRGIRRRLMPLLCFTGSLLAQSYDQAGVGRSSSVVHATAILGLENISSNDTGELSIKDDTLSFRTGDGRTARIPIGSIQDVFLSREDKEVGGTPMALGRAAAPFGGGRVIGLFAHKKYDLLTFEYRDDKGGLHGAICELNKGQGQAVVHQLEIKGVHVVGSKVDRAEQKREATNEVK